MQATMGRRSRRQQEEIMGNTIESQSPAAEAITERYINKPEVAHRLGKSLRTVDNWIQRGILPYYKIGRSVEFKWSEVEAHLAQNCRVTRRP